MNFIVRLFWPVGESFSNLQFGFFPGYISMFIIGILAFKNNWFSGFDYSLGMRWLKIALIGFLVLPAALFLGGDDLNLFKGGFHWQSLVYSSWEAFVGTGLIAGIFVIFKRRFDFQTDVSKIMADNSYSVYIIHAPVVIFFCYGIRGIAVHPLFKFVFASIVCVSLCFLIALQTMSAIKNL